MYRAIILAVLLSSSTASWAATFDYAVYLAGTKAGEARISVASLGSRYSVAGVLRSVGVLDVFTAWRGRFQAEGEITDGTALLTRYQFQERDRTNVRYVSIEDGVLRQVKNGRVRAPQIAPEGVDLLSAFVLPGGCLPRTALHLAKQSYALDVESSSSGVLARTARSTFSGDALQCRYQVDNDGSTLHATLWIAQVDGLSIPVRIEFDGSIQGGLYLI